MNIKSLFFFLIFFCISQRFNLNCMVEQSDSKALRIYKDLSKGFLINTIQEKSYYDILGIDKNATRTQIKEAYIKLSQQWHPDRNPGNEKIAQETFNQIQNAYKTLYDEETRKQYDNPTSVVKTESEEEEEKVNAILDLITTLDAPGALDEILKKILTIKMSPSTIKRFFSTTFNLLKDALDTENIVDAEDLLKTAHDGLKNSDYSPNINELNEIFNSYQRIVEYMTRNNEFGKAQNLIYGAYDLANFFNETEIIKVLEDLNEKNFEKYEALTQQPEQSLEDLLNTLQQNDPNPLQKLQAITDLMQKKSYDIQFQKNLMTKLLVLHNMYRNNENYELAQEMLTMLFQTLSIIKHPLSVVEKSKIFEAYAIFINLMIEKKEQEKAEKALKQAQELVSKLGADTVKRDLFKNLNEKIRIKFRSTKKPTEKTQEKKILLPARKRPQDKKKQEPVKEPISLVSLKQTLNELNQKLAQLQYALRN